MSAEPKLTLFSSSLLSKWGFNDGDAPDGWFDWLEEQGHDWRIGGNWRDGILPALVRRYLLPLIGQDVKVVDISTNHNPIRAEFIDGADVSDWWFDTSGNEPKLTPEYVEVPFSEVLKLAQGNQPGEG